MKRRESMNYAINESGLVCVCSGYPGVADISTVLLLALAPVIVGGHG